MRRQRESKEPLEISLERRHLVLLGLCSLVMGIFFFLLGMLTQRHFLTPPRTLPYARVQQTSPPPLYPNRSKSPDLQDEKFEFFALAERNKRAEPGKKEAKKPESHLTKRPSPSGASSASPPTQNNISSAAPATASASEKQVGQPLKEETAPPQQQNSASRTIQTASKAALDRRSLKPDENGVYALQIIALSKKSNALSYIKRLRAKGYPAFIEKARLPNGKLVYRVKVGNYQNRQRAEEVAARLKAEVGRDVWVHRAAEG